eukprot:3939683-Rhodomonas_salina.1
MDSTARLNMLTERNTFLELKLNECSTEITRLRLELYHLKMPPLRDVMNWFNYHRLETPCYCMACRVGGRIDTDDEEQKRDPVCLWQPIWDKYLQDVGATFNSADE